MAGVGAVRCGLCGVPGAVRCVVLCALCGAPGVCAVLCVVLRAWAPCAVGSVVWGVGRGECVWRNRRSQSARLGRPARAAGGSGSSRAAENDVHSVVSIQLVECPLLAQF